MWGEIKLKYYLNKFTEKSQNYRNFCVHYNYSEHFLIK